MYHEKILNSIGNLVEKVAKIDFHKGTSNRRCYARVAVYVDLKAPLVSRVYIGNRLQNVEYENLPTICFACGRFGHLQDACNHNGKPQAPTDTNAPPGNNEPSSSTGNPISNPAINESNPEEAAYGPWMVVERRRRRTQGKDNPKKETAENPRESGTRFANSSVNRNNNGKSSGQDGAITGGNKTGINAPAVAKVVNNKESIAKEPAVATIKVNALPRGASAATLK
ncbi:uncharacterized protein LOC120172303 [Hibiscus syriacus]|uniref:uncharacterized protein LOC120172303 n=1 Tax=Hibiscus syriacus TaxID=106335 RepID=UPI001921B20C|nr:uncharacterized protein LOC120172303 [Hibiscus syriacus]